MKHLFRKPAFTLAEVLITLTIIGVIAAIVIPNLLQRHFEAEMVAKLKKNFSVLNNAMAQAVRENGTADEWEINDSSTIDGAEKLYKYLKPYLKVQKECGSQGCMANEYHSLFADNAVMSSSGSSIYYKFLLEDGTSVMIWSRGNGCSNTSYKYYSMICGNLYVDLNNKQGPNRLGRDLFFFRITEKNIVPHGLGMSKLQRGDGACVFGNTDKSQNGATCAMHILYKGNMDYLRRDISSEWP